MADSAPRSFRERIVGPVIAALGISGVAGGSAYVGARSAVKDSSAAPVTSQLKAGAELDHLKAYVGKEILSYVEAGGGTGDGHPNPYWTADVKKVLGALTTSPVANRVWFVDVNSQERLTWSPATGAHFVSRQGAEQIEAANGAKYGATIAIQGSPYGRTDTATLSNGVNTWTGHIDLKTRELVDVQQVSRSGQSKAATNDANVCLPVMPCRYMQI